MPQPLADVRQQPDSTCFQVAQLQHREVGLKEQVVQLDKKLNDMQRVYMKGVKSTVDSIRAGRAVLGSGVDLPPNAARQADGGI